MSLLNAVILGIVHGIGEFFPISSSGHLAILNTLLNVSANDSGYAFFMILLRLGTVAAMLVVCWQDLAAMVYELLGMVNLGPLAGQRQGRYPNARQFIMLLLATLPLLLIIPIRNKLSALNNQSIFMGIMVILTGCVLFVSDRMRQGNKTQTSMTVFDALIIGFCQCAAAIPGLSRTGTTLTAGIATGLKPEYALKFSFLLYLPASLGYDIFSLAGALRGGVELSNVPAYLVGMVAAMIAGIFAMMIFKKIFSNTKGKFNGFSYYCWVVGALSIILSLIF